MLQRLRTLGKLAAAVSLAMVSTARAVILNVAQTGRLTADPPGRFADAGWQWQGEFRGFLGTPISKKYFITAGHIGGNVGDRMRLNGRAFVTTAYWDDPSSDLRIWTVQKKFDSWAPMYTGKKEVGKHAILFGRGTPRGAEILVNNQPHGWEWGPGDTAKSWGFNRIDAISVGASDEGQLLEFDFDRVGLGIDAEATLSVGDSGGAVFFWDKTSQRWQLAGINYSVDGPFSRTQGGTTFHGAMYDYGGLYYGEAFLPDSAADVPQKFYASRVSSNMPWIMDVLRGVIPPTSATPGAFSANVVPEPTTALLVALAPMLLLRRRAGTKDAD
jgi:hypothetical protein